jgi:hypothetical protein
MSGGRRDYFDDVEELSPSDEEQELSARLEDSQKQGDTPRQVMVKVHDAIRPFTRPPPPRGGSRGWVAQACLCWIPGGQLGQLGRQLPGCERGGIGGA